MFRFFKKKPPAPGGSEAAAPAAGQPAEAADAAASAASQGAGQPASGASDAAQPAAAPPEPPQPPADRPDFSAAASPTPTAIAPAESAAALTAAAEAGKAPPTKVSDTVVSGTRQDAAAEQDVPVSDTMVSDTEGQDAPRKASWLSRLKQGLSRTGQSLGGLFVGVKVDENLFDELESALIMADAGIEATEKLLTALRAHVRKARIDDAAQVKTALRQLVADHLRPLERRFDLRQASPLVVMIAGVNGAGKTTSIGKLAHAFQREGASVLLAAGDTFRAAAREQLVEWGSRNNVSVIAQDGGDPAAVAFDAVNAGRARGVGVVMVDTAGRLPTQLHLMEELKKIRRVIGKADAAAPHEVLLVVDGNTGQNALAQIRAFDAAIGLTGLVVTKLDGTAKGGTLAAVAAGSQGVRPIPVYWIGVGEGMEDLQPFVADEFAAALLAD